MRHWAGWLLNLAAALGIGLIGPAVSRAESCAAGGDNRAVRKDNCSVPEPASAPNNAPGSNPGSATRNSIDLVTGNKYLHELDAQWPDGLVFSRHYNSRNHELPSSLGPGWTHGYDTRLHPVRVKTRMGGSRAEIQIIQADGRRIVFDPAPSAEPRTRRWFSAGFGAVVEDADSAVDRRFVWHWLDGRRLVFDRFGKLGAIEQPGGTRLVLRYDEADRLIEVRARSGIRIGFHYQRIGSAAQAAERLNQVSLPDGSQLTLRYDSEARLQAVTNAAGETTQYDYDEFALPHALTRIRNGAGHELARFGYEPQGRAVSSALADGAQAITVRYRLPEHADGIGETIVHAGGESSHQAVELNRSPAALAPGDTLYRWRYDKHHHRSRILEARGPGCAACPPSGYCRQYDAGGRLSAEIITDQNARAQRVQWTFDALGRPRQWQSGDQLVRWHYAGTAAEAPVSAIERSSVARGMLVRVDYQRDPRMRIVRIVETGFAPDPSSLDAQLQPKRWLPIRRSVAYRYGERGGETDRLIAIDGPLPGSGDSTLLRYDARSLLSAELRPGERIARFERDPFGRLIGVEHPDGELTRLGYDRASRLDSIRHGEHVTRIERNADALRAQFFDNRSGPRTIEFDAAQRPVALTDALGARLTLHYGADDQLTTAVITEAGGSAQRSIDRAAAGAIPPPANGEYGSVRAARVDFVDRDGEKTTWLYDDFGNRVIEASASFGTRVMRYDAAGHPVAVASYSTARRVAVVLARYDAAGRLVALGPPGDPLRWQRRYSGDRLVAESEPYLTRFWNFDAKGRLVGQASVIGSRGAGPRQQVVAVSGFVYDGAGRLTARTIPGGHALGYSYDANGKLAAIAHRSADAAAPVMIATDLNWRAFSGGEEGLSGWRAGNGVAAQMDFDAQGRLSRLRHVGSPRGLPQLALQYGADGRIESIDRDGERESFRYDRLGRLVAAHGGFGELTFRHGRTGVETVPAQPAALAVRAAWRADQVERTRQKDHGADANDADAAVASTAAPTLLWTATDRPAAALRQGQLRALYAYSMRGERLAKLAIDDADAATPSARIYLHENGKLVGELDGAGRLISWTVHIGHRPIAMLRVDSGSAGQWIWLHSDHLGSVRAATDSAGRLRWAAHYNPFGRAYPRLVSDTPESQDALPSISVDWRFPGQTYDAQSGLHENVYRSYDPVRGRYTSADPLGPFGGPDAYQYAGGDPINSIDPYGLYQIDVHYYMVFFLAISAGVDYDKARTIAMAAQYVDDNPDTRPFDDVTDNTITNGVQTALRPGHVERLASYHFVLDQVQVSAREQNDARIRQNLWGSFGFDTPIPTRVATPIDIRPPQSGQLNRLRNAISMARGSCARWQFLGEFIHPFSDTYSHRDRFNAPIQADGSFVELVTGAVDVNRSRGPTWGFGAGHARFGEQPDLTYDDAANGWSSREARTLQMERAVFELLQQYRDPNSRSAKRWEEIEGVVREFNAVRERGERGSTDRVSFSRKIGLLNDGLRSVRIKDPRTGEARPLDLLGEDQYDELQAEKLRDSNLRGLDQRDFPGTIFPGTGSNQR